MLKPLKKEQKEAYDLDSDEEDFDTDEFEEEEETQEIQAAPEPIKKPIGRPPVKPKEEKKPEAKNQVDITPAEILASVRDHLRRADMLLQYLSE